MSNASIYCEKHLSSLNEDGKSYQEELIKQYLEYCSYCPVNCQVSFKRWLIDNDLD